jgi:hypothetical protein
MYALVLMKIIFVYHDVHFVFLDRCSDPPVSRAPNEYCPSHQNGSQFLQECERNIYYGWKYGR